MKQIQILENFLNKIHNPAQFDITRGGVNIAGSLVISELYNYEVFYIYGDLLTNWLNFVEITVENFIKAYNAENEEYNVFNNINLTEISVANENDSKTTETRTPDVNSGTITKTAINAQRTETPNTTRTVSEATIDSGALKQVQTVADTGSTTTTTTAQADNNLVEYVDNLKYTIETEHEKQTINYNGKDYTGDNIKVNEFTRKGTNGNYIASELIAAEIKLRKTNVFKEYIRKFVDTYCFYVGDGSPFIFGR